MDEWYMWQTFFTMGSVLDYVRYKSIQEGKNPGVDTVLREETDEVPYERTDYPRNEYR